MKTYSQRHNSEQAAKSALTKLSILGDPGVECLHVMRHDNRLHPVIYIDPNRSRLDPVKKASVQRSLSDWGFTVMFGSVPETLMA